MLVMNKGIIDMQIHVKRHNRDMWVANPNMIKTEDDLGWMHKGQSYHNYT